MTIYTEERFNEVVVTVQEGIPSCIFEPIDSNPVDLELATLWLTSHHPGLTMRATEEEDGTLWLLDVGKP